MSMFDKIKEQANRAATSKTHTLTRLRYILILFYFIGAAALGQTATRSVGDMATNASKLTRLCVYVLIEKDLCTKTSFYS